MNGCPRMMRFVPQHTLCPSYRVAEIVVQWIKDGMPEMNKDFIASVWQNVKVEHLQKR